MITLAIGGFLKALCIVNPGINLEVLNFTPGIYNGNISIVNRCARFPLQAEYVQMSGIPTSFRDILTLTSGIKKKAWKIKEVENIFPAQSVFKNYIIDYNIFGLLSIKSPASQLSFNVFNDFLHNLNKVHIWSIEKQTRAIFDMVQKQQHFELFDNNVKNLFSDEWLNFVNQTTQFSTQESDSDLHTIFIDKKTDNYIYGPRISIAPSYIGILQYYITYSKPTTPNLIALLITKRSSKLYAMIERSPLCYTVTYTSDYYENQILFDSNFVNKKTKILYIHEKGMNQTLQLNFLSTNISVTRLEISNLEEVMFYGGAIYALQNSNTTLTSPYVTIDPLFDPEENNIEGTSTVSRRTSTCFYEIEAFFHGALKSINSALFYGDLIAIILQRKKNVHIYFFIHVKNKFLFKNDITISTYETINASLLHFADYILVDSDYSKLLKFAEDLPLNCFKWDKTVGVDEFLKDMKEQKLLIYENSNYSESILAAKNYKILQNVIFEKMFMTIEYQAEKCRILLKNDHCIALQNEEWIPKYVTFLKTLPIVGKEAEKDLEKSPESVIYDFLTLIGSTSKTITFDPKWKFQLVEMDESDDPKIGYKVKTIEGYKIISPEMALTIYLQKLINIYEKHIGKNVDEIRIRLMDTVLTKIQKEAFENAAKRLKKSILFC
uniref:Uncharacterized protein n=1 Tax=Panagrolaimus davidi TaxID=227884 RepID=A0A914Q9P0_9BILA